MIIPKTKIQLENECLKYNGWKGIVYNRLRIILYEHIIIVVAAASRGEVIDE